MGAKCCPHGVDPTDLWYFGNRRHVAQCASCTAGDGAAIRKQIHSHCSRLKMQTLCCSFSLNSWECLPHGKEQTHGRAQQALTHQDQISSIVNKPQRAAHDFKLAGEEITHLVNNCCRGPVRTVVRCGKQFNGIARRAR